MKTFMQKPADVKRQWHVVDAKGQILGQVATEIAKKLMGKEKVTFSPHVDSGDYVVVTNAKEVVVTGNKATDKLYYSYSGFAGGLRKQTFNEVLAKHPERIIEKAVYNMLPDNSHRRSRMARLKVYEGVEHPHQSQVGTQSE